MAVLNSWQRIDRVLKGNPFGDKANGNATLSADPHTRQSCSGSSAQKNLTIASGAFSNGDVVLIMQQRGTGVLQWEVNQIASGGGTTTLVMKENLYYTYTDSGASQAQVINIPRYNTLTVNSFTLTGWNKNVGGVLALAGIDVTIATGQTLTATAKGYDGGNWRNSVTSAPYEGYSGEGTVGDEAIQPSANGNGGGGGDGNGGFFRASGAGGGNGSDGGNATGYNSGTAVGGSTVGAADLTTISFGGGGGGGSMSNGGEVGGTGGIGGGIVIIFAKTLTVNGNITNNGGVGGNSNQDNGGAGGGGAGGSVLIVVGNASLGTTKITATGGAGGVTYNGANNGGAGGTGRIAVHHSGTVTGTTNPTYTDILDKTLKILPKGGFMLTQFL